MSLESIILFSGVEILPNIDKQHAIEYLKRYCTIDDLGDSIRIQKLGNDKTTFVIDFELDQITLVKKIKDENGCNIEDILFERILDDEDYDDIADKHNMEINS